jgi:putative peptide zinc metalloprotease protein
LKLEDSEDIPTRTRNGMVLYAILTMMYRLSLYIVVALFVYYKFTKLLGITLFLVEIGVFIIWPVIDEFRELVRMRTLMRFNWRLFCTTTAIFLFIMWFAVPIGHQDQFPAVIVPKEDQIFYAPQDSYIETINVKKGQIVQKGDVLFQLSSKSLDTDIQAALSEEQRLRRELLIKGQGLKDVIEESRPEIEAQLSTAKSQFEELKALKQRLVMKADFAGRVYHILEPINVGQFVKRNEQLAKVANFQNLEAIAYVPEERVSDLKVGDRVTLKPNTHTEDILGTIIRISPYSKESLSYNQLSSIFKGELPVNKDPETGKLLFVESYYEIVVQLDNIPAGINIGQMGHVIKYNVEQSKLLTYLKRFYVQIWKESSL